MNGVRERGREGDREGKREVVLLLQDSGRATSKKTKTINLQQLLFSGK